MGFVKLHTQLIVVFTQFVSAFNERLKVSICPRVQISLAGFEVA